MSEDASKKDELDVTQKDEKTKEAKEADVAYEKKVEDKAGRDWSKRANFKPTNGV
ncbi:MAG: hypothetical protein LBG97_02405 [Coriobacteriales bacterium]|jgi:hypothetical protein|nr:hypothetical protein [Coriobacteriales bacterium]